MHQARLRRLQFLQSALGRVARRADFGLGALALRDVAKNDDEAAAWHLLRISLAVPPHPASGGRKGSAPFSGLS
jgi:hypothetical protein